MTLKTKAFGDIITFTRASGGGRFNSSGVYEWLGNDVPRLDYDPVTLEPRGILIEEQRTNLLTYSEQFDNAAWTKSNISATANATIAPDGLLTAYKLVETTANGTHIIAVTPAVTANTNYVASVFLKAGGRTKAFVRYGKGSPPYTRIGVQVDLTTGSFVSYNVGSPTSITQQSVQSVGHGWYRVSVAGTFDTASTDGRFQIDLLNDAGVGSYTGDGTSGIYIWGAQLEAGAFPTSYIPTVASQVTRSADVASVNTLSPWYNASEGTIVVKATRFTTISSVLYQLIKDASLNSIWCRSQYGGSAEQFVSVVGGVNQAVFTPAAALTHRSAFAYKENDFAVSLNGASALTDVSGSVPSGITRLDIGHVAGSRTNGHIQSLEYYPRRLSNTELQEITA